jgi:hypothetical protein
VEARHHIGMQRVFELVAIRPILCKDKQGNLFGNMMQTEKNRGGGGTRGASIANDERWALTLFFGESQHALLHLPYEARDLFK